MNGMDEPDDHFTISFQYILPSTYQKAMSEVGFIDFKYEPITISEDTPE